MFGIKAWLEKRRVRVYIDQRLREAKADTTARWFLFCQSYRLPEGASFAQQVHAFSIIIRPLLDQECPFATISARSFWITIGIAIIESGTHSQSAVVAALKEIQETHQE